MGSFSLRNMTVVKKVDQLEKWLKELKNRQAMGNDVITIKESLANSDDYDFTLTAAAGYVFKYLVFVPNQQTNPMGVFRFQVGSGSIDNTAAPSQFNFSIQDQTVFETVEGRIVYGANIYNIGATTLYYKVHMYATDYGTVHILDSYTYGQAL